ncbi:MAG: class E sortase [Candidatus Saccharimonadales bacterium]
MSNQTNNQERRYRIANWYLLGAIILINAYIALAPLLPQLQFWIEKHGDTQTTLTALTATEDASPPQESDPHTNTNHLVVPSMLLNEPVYQGRSEATLSKGIWHRPNTSTPDKGGNTVFAAHRYTYTNPRGTFYYLDKVAVGDPIALFWEGKKYVYKITSTTTVKATQIEVEAPTKEAQLTLYTCTPLWLPKDRLVVTALLENIYE